MVETIEDSRNSLILKWYENKLNKDVLLKVLYGIGIIGEETKKNIEREIIKNFNENYEKAKQGIFEVTEEEYRDIDNILEVVKVKIRDISEKEKAYKKELEEIEDETFFDIGKDLRDTEDGPLYKKIKLWRKKRRWEDLVTMERNIRTEKGKLEIERMKMERLLDGINKKIKEQNMIDCEFKVDESDTLKGLKFYKEKYYENVKRKEEFYSIILKELEKMEMGISEEKRKKVLEQLKKNMYNEIEVMKEGNDVMRYANEIEKWLYDNYKIKMEEIVKLQEDIKQNEYEIQENERKQKEIKSEGISLELNELKNKEFELKKRQIEMQGKCDGIKSKLKEKIKEYCGKDILWGDNLKIETFEEMLNRIL